MKSVLLKEKSANFGSSPIPSFEGYPHTYGEPPPASPTANAENRQNHRECCQELAANQGRSLCQGPQAGLAAAQFLVGMLPVFIDMAFEFPKTDPQVSGWADGDMVVGGGQGWNGGIPVLDDHPQVREGLAEILMGFSL